MSILRKLLGFASMVIATPIVDNRMVADATTVSMMNKALPASEGSRTLPQNWRAPSHGHHSAKCWKSPSNSDIHGMYNSQSELVNSDHTRADTGSVLLSRQPHEVPDVLEANMLAAYHFTCPQGGRITQVFFWGVTYTLGNHHVTMIPWRNILNFAGTSFDEEADVWASSWTSLWCMPLDKAECWYLAVGHTHGEVDWVLPEITVELYLPARDHPDHPRVAEFCGEIGHAPQLHTGGTSCIITNIQVFNEPGGETQDKHLAGKTTGAP